jgi:Zn-dependent protease with chaperone function
MHLSRIEVAVFLLSACLISASCTTSGPTVSSQEVSQRRSDLEAKAVWFKATQVRRVEAIAERLLRFMPPEDQAKLAGIRYEVSDSSDINAGVGAGKLVVNYGMLRFTESDDELATVIAHELAHVVKGHYAKKLATSVVANVIGIAAGAALDTVTQTQGMGQTVASGIAGGITGGFSRDLEREADYYGFQYVYVAGFDLAGGALVWERLAVEAPQSMTAGLFSTHPSSPERLVRAEKTLAELAAQGVQANVFSRPVPVQAGGGGSLTQALSVPMRTLTGPASAVVSSLARPVAFTGTGSGSDPSGPSGSSPQPQVQTSSEASAVENTEITYLREEVKRLRAREEARLQQTEEELRREAVAKEELERALAEAKEAAKHLRYAEFGVLEMGLARKVTNLWIGKSVSGGQRIFSLSQGSVDWYVQYQQWSSGSWKALAMIERKYRAYWYSPDGRLFSEQDFTQSKIRTEFAKTTLKWDPGLGDFLKGRWQLRVFENGKLLDERTFELV